MQWVLCWENLEVIMGPTVTWVREALQNIYQLTTTYDGVSG
jgi:hypothetical protein